MDANEIAKRIVDEATGGTPPSTKNQAAVELGRRGGLKGGRARAESLTPAQRTAAAQHAARVRWGTEQARMERLHRLVPTSPRFPYGQRAAYRIVTPGPCANCGQRLSVGVICTMTTRNNYRQEPVCQECLPFLCTIEQLGLGLPEFPDPRLWWPGGRR